MPLTRQQKEDLVQEYSQGLAKAPHVFLVDYKGVTVTQPVGKKSCHSVSASGASGALEWAACSPALCDADTARADPS